MSGAVYTVTELQQHCQTIAPLPQSQHLRQINKPLAKVKESTDKSQMVRFRLFLYIQKTLQCSCSFTRVDEAKAARQQHARHTIQLHTRKQPPCVFVGAARIRKREEEDRWQSTTINLMRAHGEHYSCRSRDQKVAHTIRLVVKSVASIDLTHTLSLTSF